MDETQKLLEFKKIKYHIDNGNLLGPFDVDWFEENRLWLEKKRIEWDTQKTNTKTKTSSTITLSS